MAETSMADHPAYKHYWRRKELLVNGVPPFPVRRWWPTDGQSEIEQIYFDSLRHCPSLLDVGAGDGRIMRKLRALGYSGEYHSLDIGEEYEHTYRDLSEVTRPYAAIICLDVIEHMSLVDGLTMLERLASLLTTGGVLILQTPNARCIRNQLGTDMTHVQIYNPSDLWAFLTCLGLDTIGYRITFGKAPAGLSGRVKGLIGRWVTSRLLGADSADNIAMIAHKNDQPKQRGG